MTLEDLIDLLDEAEMNYYGDFATEMRRNEFLARYIIDALAAKAAPEAEAA